MSTLREECGVFGVFSPEKTDAASTAYYGLFALQHRGQESCGIVVNDDGLFQTYKDTGLVNDVFTPQILESLGEGNMAVGHVRYGTTGGNDRSNAQPIVVNHIKGITAILSTANSSGANWNWRAPFFPRPAIRRLFPISLPRKDCMRRRLSRRSTRQ